MPTMTLDKLADLIQSDLEQSKLFQQHLGKMTITLVSYRDEQVFQRFQDRYYSQYGDHFCYTISDWISLDEAMKVELHGQNVMIIKPRDEVRGFNSSMLFSAKRHYVQRGEEFITVRDALGLSGIAYTPSHSY